MKKRPLIVLLGDSLLVDSVAVGLGAREALDVARMDAITAETGEGLKSLSPDLIVFELDTPWSPAILSLLREQPGTQLLGLDLTCSQVIVLSSHPHTTRTMKELYQLVRTKLDHRAPVWKGGEFIGQESD